MNLIYALLIIMLSFGLVFGLLYQLKRTCLHEQIHMEDKRDAMKFDFGKFLQISSVFHVTIFLIVFILHTVDGSSVRKHEYRMNQKEIELVVRQDLLDSEVKRFNNTVDSLKFEYKRH